MVDKTMMGGERRIMFLDRYRGTIAMVLEIYCSNEGALSVREIERRAGVGGNSNKMIRALGEREGLMVVTVEDVKPHRTLVSLTPHMRDAAFFLWLASMTMGQEIPIDLISDIKERVSEQLKSEDEVP